MFTAVVRILNVPLIAMRFVLGIVAIARTTVDRIIGHLIDRLLRFGVYEPRLTMLITTLESKRAIYTTYSHSLRE